MVSKAYHHTLNSTSQNKMRTEVTIASAKIVATIGKLISESRTTVSSDISIMGLGSDTAAEVATEDVVMRGGIPHF